MSQRCHVFGGRISAARVLSRVCDHVKINRITGCWEWQRLRDKDGYGKITIDRRFWLVHRAVYVAVFGDIPKGYFVCHRCDNPSCVNPQHLFCGTQQDNTKDMLIKNRQAKGEEIGSSKLTPCQIAEIRSLYVPRVVTRTFLAKKYGVGLATIHYILARKTWNHLRS